MLAKFRLIFDNFTLILISVIITATILPAQGDAAIFFGWLTRAAIALLFFMHGAKLSRQAIIAGMTHWRLHLLVFSFSFIAFPVIGWLLKPVMTPLLGVPLTIGMLYLCALPGTVQSAIAFTSIAKGNIPAAVCSASASSIIGIVATPVILNIMLDTNAGTTGMGKAIMDISLQLLLPFVLGHLSRPITANFIIKNSRWLKNVDQSSIVLVVYTAFSASVVSGLWQAVPPLSLAALFGVCLVLLAIVLFLTSFLATRFGFNQEDKITIVFCASKKSLATGVPMAQVLFSSSMLGPVLLPIMIFHQIQLMACSILANQYAMRAKKS